MSLEFWLLVVLLLRYAPVEATEQSAFLKPYEYTYETDKKTWEEAKAACETKGAVLAKVGSDAIKTTLQQFPVGGGAWIGATDRETEGVWKWLADGTLIDGSDSYTTWESLQPDDWKNNGHPSWRDGEDCGILKGDGMLNDAHCIQNRFGYICQKNFVFTDVYRLYFSNDKKSWNDAEAYCQTDGSNLAKMDLSNLTSLISDKFNSADRWRWIGANRPEGRGEWKWSNGNGVNSPINWRVGEPNGGTSQNCAAVDAVGKWMDHSCFAEIKYICQKRLPTTVSHNGHVFTFHRTAKVNWDAAKTGCATSGSRLVEIYDTTTNDVIRNNILNPGQMFYSGGSLSSRTVTWDSGATAGNLPAWAAGEPNNNGQSKIALSTRGWVDVDQTLMLPYICEMVNMTTITSRQTILTVGVDSDREVTCSADGIPTANVFWKFSSVKVRSSNVEGGSPVYQTEAEGSSILHLEGAKLTDEGTYTCVAEHRAGTFRKTLQKGFILAVPSVPDTAIVEVMNCSTEIEVRWEANARAQNINHRIIVMNAQDASEIHLFPNVQSTNKTFRFTARKWRMYDITVMPCPNDACKEKYSLTNRTTRRTVGRPGLATHLQIRSLKNYSCSFSWEKPNDVPEEYITKYKVIVKARLHRSSDVSTFIETRNELTMNREVKRYSTREKPNFLYTFGVQVQTCAGNGNITWFSRCVTDAKAPENVKKPVAPMYVNSNGTMMITVTIPSHENGLMSCLFVIVKRLLAGSNTIDSRTEYKREDLVQANKTNGERIAFALNLTSGFEGQKNVTLGDGGGSTCQLSAGGVDNNIIVGQNLRLDPYQNYSIFVVTSTPTTQNGIVFKASTSAQVLAIPEPVPDYYVYSQPHEYVFVTVSKTWSDTKAACEARNAILVKVGSANVTWITENFPVGHTSMWIGASKSGGKWKWLADGTRVRKSGPNSNWRNSSQNNGNCAVVESDGLWNTLPCTALKRGFVCQKHMIFTDLYQITFSYDEKKWEKAKGECEKQHAHLIKIDSLSLTDIIKASNIGTDMWIGANDKVMENDWKWLDGTDANKISQNYVNWHSNEPDDSGDGEDCAVVSSKGTWSDRQCTSTRNYICQKRLTFYTDQYQLYFSHYEKTWSKAKEECEKRSSHLVKINDDSLTSFISNNSDETRWIGAAVAQRESGTNKCDVIQRGGVTNGINCSSSKKFICQKDLPDSVSQNGHVFTFYRMSRVNWDVAKTGCASEGSRLAEIYNKATDDVIKSSIIDPFVGFHSGGNNDGGKVMWEIGGTTSYKPEWSFGEPKSTQHSKIALSANGWKSVSSNTTLPYICEMANLTKITLSKTTLTIGVDVKENVTCSANGVPFSNVFWKSSSSTVPTDGAVYQGQGNGKSVLHVGGATLIDEGIYSCVAENKAGNFSIQLIQNFTLNVPSVPEFVIAEVEKCSSNITVKWRANQRAQNIRHWITVTNIENESDIYSFSDLLKEQFSFEARKWKNYEISVTPCPDDTCKEKYTAVNYTRQRTTGLPGTVRNLKVQVSNKYYCQIGWDKPSEYPTDAISGFKVTVKKALSYRPGGSQATESIRYFNISGTKREYLLVGDPNHEYMFGIQAVTCMGFGSIVWSNNSCVTDAAVPKIITKPQVPKFVNENGTMQVDIRVPSQENGQISCLFVIVKVMMNGSIAPDSASAGSFLLADLNQANTSNQEYIAIVVDMDKVGQSFIVTLGNETLSKCKVSTKEKNAFVGRNLKLDQYKDISVILVTSTPTRDGTLYKASGNVQVMAIPKPVKDEVYFTDQYRLYFSTGKVTREQAKKDCEKSNSHLIKIDSDSLTDVIKNNSEENRWIGASEENNVGDWRWLDGTTATKGSTAYTKWRGDDPNGAQHGEHCAIARSDGQWNDVSCTTTWKSICQKRLPTTVSHNGRKFVFHRAERVNWDEAKRLCGSKGSRLAEIYDEETNNVIKSNIINPSADFFCGGKLDGSTVSWDSGRSASYISGWADGEADDIQHNRIALSSVGWKDMQSSNSLPYICEMANLTNTQLSVTHITIGKGDVVESVCSADGVPFSNVYWRFSSTVVTDDSSGTVYQTKGNGESVLHVANAVFTDEGTYTCFAENQAGNFSKTLHEEFQLKVPSTPEFVTVEPEACSPRITVRWKPNSRARNVAHQIIIRNEKNENERYEFGIPPKAIPDETLTVDVKEWMFYNVKVKVCRNGDCKNTYSKQNRTSSPTVGRPGNASNLNVEVSNKYSCSIKWQPPNDNTSEYISNYKVIIKKRRNYPEELTAAESTKTVDKKQTTYVTEEKANMRYEFGIQAETCAGVGEIVWSEESCVTAPKAPDKVAKPELSASTFIDGTIEVTINIPSQENGPISCLFVIVKAREAGDKVLVNEYSRNYTIDDLIRTNNFTNTAEYMALALRLESLYGNNKVTLGDERTTICEISPTLKRKKRSVNSNVFVGRNLKLDSSKSNSVYIVASFSTDGEILLIASENAVVPNQRPGDSKNILWIIGVILGSIALLLLISIGVYVKKSQSTSSSGAVVQGKAATTSFVNNIPRDDKAQGYKVIDQDTVAARSEAPGRNTAEPSYIEPIPHQPSNKNYEVVDAENRREATANPTNQTNAETAYAPYVLQLEERPEGYDAINVAVRQEQSENVYFKIAESDYEPIRVTEDALP